MAIPATLLRPGMVIKHNGELYAVFSVEHRTPGNKRGFIQARLRNLRSGALADNRFRAEDDIDRVVVDEVEMEFLYHDGGDYHFMNTETFEQLHLTRDTLGDAVDYLIPNLKIMVEFYEGRPIGVEPPATVDLQVVDTEPGMRSATASAVLKQAKLETGLTVLVPQFVTSGETIRVDTAEGAYLERVK